MQLQGGSTNLQGGSINVQPQKSLPIDTRPAPNIQLQPAANPMSYPASAPVYQPAPAAPSYVSQPPSGGGVTQGVNTYAPAPQAQAAPPPPPPDPYAAWGGKVAYDRLVSGYNTQDQNIHATSDEAAQSSALGLHGSILDYLNGITTSQNAINESGVQNELAKKQGYMGIMDMVGQGLQSGGVILANRNAPSSSAAEAIARAYGKLGQREGNKVNNQYEQGQRKIGLSQADLERTKVLGRTKIDDSRAQAVNNIVLSARDRLATLDSQIAGSNLPNRIAIDNEKAQIQRSVQGILDKYNGELNNGVAGITPTSPDARRASAQGLATAGVAAANPFEVNTSAPAEFQDTGPFTGELPLFTVPRKKTA